MNVLTSTVRRLFAVLRRIREWSSGDDLHDAQMNRGDDHEFKSNPGGP